jgi:hypothetical protein
MRKPESCHGPSGAPELAAVRFILSAFFWELFRMDEEKMNNTNDEGKELLDVLSSVEKKGNKIADKGRQLTHRGQEIADVAQATRNVIEIVNQPPNYKTYYPIGICLISKRTTFSNMRKSMNCRLLIAQVGLQYIPQVG